MFRWQTLAGLGIGLALGVTLLALLGGRQSTPASGAILPECDGHLRDLVIHYEASAKQMTAPVYRDFLGALEPEITVYVVCSNREAFEDLTSTLGPLRCRLKPVVVNHAITTWSRDRWLALGPAQSGPTTLLSPKAEAAEEIWPARAGDERVGQDIADALSPSVWARRSEFYFDGGDFLADSENVFVVSRVLQRNIQHTVRNAEEFMDILSAQLKRRAILLDASPDHHAAMFMMSAGNRTMLVADPSLGKKFLASEGTNTSPGFRGEADFTPETQKLFDAVAAQCAAAGYKVIRIPVVPGRDSRTYLTYVNVIIDQQGSRRIVYLPYYRGVEQMNAAARAVWENLGYEVRPVDCTTTYPHFGCLHCLVNVLKRS